MTQKQFAIITVGKTHTGKSTFAKELSLSIPEFVVLEADPIALFLNEHFPKLHKMDRTQNGNSGTLSVKIQIFQMILSNCLKYRQNIILANSNLSKRVRGELLGQIKKDSYATIGIFLNYPEEILFKRIKTSNRDQRVLTLSKDFEEVIINQRKWLEAPDP